MHSAVEDRTTVASRRWLARPAKRDACELRCARALNESSVGHGSRRAPVVGTADFGKRGQLRLLLYCKNTLFVRGRG